MKILVSCDEWCCCFQNDFYLSNFGMTLVKRYLMAYDQVRLVIRAREAKSIDELGNLKVKVSDPRIEIYSIPFFQGPKQYAKVYFQVQHRLEKVSEGCSLAIIRLPSTTGFVVWDKVKNKIPFAVEVVADCYDLYKGHKSLINKMLWYRMHTKMLSACNHAIGVSCVTRDYLQKRYKPLSSQAVLAHYSSVEMLPEFRYKARKFPQKDRFEVILVTNQVYLNSYKGHKTVLDVVKLLKERNCEIQVTFVGADYFGGFKQIRDYASSKGILDNIRFTGLVNTVELKNLLINADILILPTRAEGLPRVVIEGMALGLPCVTTPVSGNPELIDKEFLVDYSDVEGFAEKIQCLVTNKELYEQQSLRNFERSREYCKDVLDDRRKDFFMKLTKFAK